MCRISLIRFLSTLFLIAAVVAVSGCGRKSRVSASGRVTLQGETLKHRAVLTFVGSDHVPRSTQTDSSGEFRIADLPLGEVIVTVSSIPDGGPAPRPLNTPNDSPTQGRFARGSARAMETLSEYGGASQSNVDSSEVPSEYGDAGQPLLRYTLQKGNNPLEIALTAMQR